MKVDRIKTIHDDKYTKIDDLQQFFVFFYYFFKSFFGLMNKEPAKIFVRQTLRISVPLEYFSARYSFSKSSIARNLKVVLCTIFIAKTGL